MSSLISIMSLWLLLQMSCDDKEKPVDLLQELYSTGQITDTLSVADWLSLPQPVLDKEFAELYESLYAFVYDFVQRVKAESDIRPFLDSYDLNHNDTRPAYTITACTCSGQPCVGCAEEGQV